LRNGKVSLAESFVKYKDNEIWLEGAHIEEFAQAAEDNHDPLRSRKLLARKRQIGKWGQRVKEKGLTIVPLRL
ncbi:MAG TPA: SsrA-binding protein, partial [Planctomycetes bacterium]|nr:SsrA-binding protein [Planctomycetota bacterium]